MGEPIFAGLRRVFTEPVDQPVEAALPGETTGRPRAPDRVSGRLGEAGVRIVAAGRTSVGWAVRAAAERSITPSSVTGISLLTGLCAAAWFSGGSQPDAVRGLMAAGVWVFSRAGARQLAAMTAPPGERRFGWMYAVGATAAECAIYGGIAAGAQATGYSGTWPLALGAVIASAVATIARAIEPSRTRRHPFGVPPIGLTALLAALIVVTYGPRIALFVVLVLNTSILARSLVRTGRLTRSGQAAVDQRVLLACRDDGPLARRAGWLVRGNLMPVPPAVAGVIAIGLLTVLGLRNLPGVVALTPVVVLLLAAPGSSHPHDGRFDWLVPVLLALGQFGYLAALGAARPVSWVLIFTAGSMTAVWYASLAASAAWAPDRRSGIGWDGRAGLIGLTSMFGIATVGYLGLTACLAAQICGQAVSDYLRQGEDRRL